MAGKLPTVADLRFRVRLQSRTTAPDTFGKPIPTWSDVATVWADVEETGGREVWNGKQVQADVTHMVTLRYYPGLGPKMRFVLESGARVEIKSAINPDRVKVWHRCECVQELS